MISIQRPCWKVVRFERPLYDQIHIEEEVHFEGPFYHQIQLEEECRIEIQNSKIFEQEKLLMEEEVSYENYLFFDFLTANWEKQLQERFLWLKTNADQSYEDNMVPRTFEELNSFSPIVSRKCTKTADEVEEKIWYIHYWDSLNDWWAEPDSWPFSDED